MDINKKIERDCDTVIIDSLSDTILLEDYRKLKSVKNKIKELKNILETNKVDETKQQHILNDYILNLIPPGAKAVVKGLKFNKIIKSIINNLDLDTNRFEICFEKHFEKITLSEIPDWYIYDKKLDKILFGMNQLDLWSGGHQLNRASKYIIENRYVFDNKIKVLSVICNKTKVLSTNSKKYKIFNIGFKNKTLCYTTEIEFLIKEFFSLEQG